MEEAEYHGIILNRPLFWTEELRVIAYLPKIGECGVEH